MAAMQARVAMHASSLSKGCSMSDAPHSLSCRVSYRELPFHYNAGARLQGLYPVRLHFVERGTGRLRVSAAVREVTGSVMKGKELRFAVVAGRFNEIITKKLLAGALDTFKRYEVQDDNIDVVWVPGSFEIPVVAQALAKSQNYHAVLCIGAVIRGATSHYDAVANSAASGIMSAGLKSGVPCIFGVLTCDTMEQAIDRAGGKAGNKGAEVAITTVACVVCGNGRIAEGLLREWNCCNLGFHRALHRAFHLQDGNLNSKVRLRKQN